MKEKSKDLNKVEKNVNNFTILNNQELKDQIAKLEITSIDYSINQVPSSANDHTAIVTSEISTPQGKFSGIGAASSETIDGPTDPQMIIDQAMNNSTVRSLGLARATQPSPFEPDVIPKPNDRQVQRFEESPQKKQYKHSTNKPMTDSQRSTLTDIAKRNKMTLEEAAQNFIGKPMEQLSSYDANQLFQVFNNK